MTEKIKIIESDDRREEVRVSEQGGVERREHIIEDKAAGRRNMVNKLTQFIWLVAGIVQGLLTVRFFLKLLAANPENPFARLVYNLTDLFLWPFLNLTASPSVDGMVLEIPSLVAIFVYILIAWGLASLVQLFVGPSRARAISVQERSR